LRNTIEVNIYGLWYIIFNIIRKTVLPFFRGMIMRENKDISFKGSMTRSLRTCLFTLHFRSFSVLPTTRVTSHS
jgi:hypothetical protein